MFVLLFYGIAAAAASGPGGGVLNQAYDELRLLHYDAAIALFEQGIAAAPGDAAARKDLAYTYLKTGETELAREQFGEAMRLDPVDTHVALEYAFLCHETRRVGEARRVFDRLRKQGDATAAAAFERVDAPLRAAIEQWTKAIALGGENAGAHLELARAAEDRDELALAAEHFEKAWRLRPESRGVLLDLGRVWRAMGRTDSAVAALLAASRGGEARAAESARELLPERYPFVAEFRQALALDSGNAEMRRELAYLLLRMGQGSEAEVEFELLTKTVPGDMLSATQLGFLRYARGDRAGAMPLFERVMAGNDLDLANRVRAVLRLPQVLPPQKAEAPPSLDAKLMAERSLKAGYLKDALRYLELAQAADPVDFEVMLKLGWTYNSLRQDQKAVRWFDLARRSPDPLIASEAESAWSNLRSGTAPVQLSLWWYPMFSTRWHDLFSYSQVKVAWQRWKVVRPYLSIRLVGDTRAAERGTTVPQYLSESSAIFAVGLQTSSWHGATAWFEAGNAVGYRSGHLLPDYRGGISLSRARGTSLTGEGSGWFADAAMDAVFVSRFGNDSLVSSQNRGGYSTGGAGIRAQLYWNANVTVDSKREAWANYAETGPGLRWRTSGMPQSMYLHVNLLRGAYLINQDNPRRPNFNDFRAGIWYAFTY